MADLLDDYAVLGDTELVTLIRHGSLVAWWEIERRHGHAMRRLNRVLDPIGRYGDPSADAHTIAYHSLAQGVGPATALRPYLLMLAQRLHTVRLASPVGGPGTIEVGVDPGRREIRTSLSH